MQTAVPLACFLSIIRPPGVQYENALLQIAPVDKSKCPFVKNGNDVDFQLFTRHNPTAYQDLRIDDDEKLFASNIDFNDPTVIFFHAFMEEPDDGSGIMIREAYMQRGDTNVIMVDAHRLEAGPWYFTAAQNTWYIGRFAAQFIDYLVSRGLHLNNTHLVGHSLGAQSAGVAGAYIKSGRVSRITGLDPALPLFSHLPLEQRLDPTDADFVDVIHTDAGIFGFKDPIGHVDFYPNGGKSPQPGCELEVVLPKQLLLNKCDDTEQARGIYTYYLTSKHIISDDTPLTTKPQSISDETQDNIDKQNSTITKHIRNTNPSEIADRSHNKTPEQELPKHFKLHNINPPNKYDRGILEVMPKEVNIQTQMQDNTSNLGPTDTKQNISATDLEKTQNLVSKDKKDDSEIHDTINQEFLGLDQLESTDSKLTVPHENDHTFNNEMIKLDEIESTDKETTQFLVPQKNHANKLLTRNQDTMRLIQQELPNRYTKPVKLNQINIPGVNIYTADSAQYISQQRKDFSKIDSTLNLKEIKTSKEFPYTNLETTRYTGFQKDLGLTERDTRTNKPDIKHLDTKSTHEKEITEQNQKHHTYKRNLDSTERLTLVAPNQLLKEIHWVSQQTLGRAKRRQKRFLNFFKSEDESFVFKALNFLIKNGKNVLPIFSVVREINTLVKSANGELNHVSKESNNYIGVTPPVLAPVTYSLELGSENKFKEFVKRLLGIGPSGQKLTVSGK